VKRTSSVLGQLRTIINCQLYIQDVWQQVGENLRNNSISKNKTKLKTNKITMFRF